MLSEDGSANYVALYSRTFEDAHSAVVLVRDGHAFEPFDAVGRVAAGTTTPAEWALQCAALGIAGRVLSTPPTVGTV